MHRQRNRRRRFSVMSTTDRNKGRARTKGLTLRSLESAPRTYMALLNCERKHWVELPDHGLIVSAVLGGSSIRARTHGRPEVVNVCGLGAAHQL